MANFQFYFTAGKITYCFSLRLTAFKEQKKRGYGGVGSVPVAILLLALILIY
jgi:hypothetical protein